MFAIRIAAALLLMAGCANAQIYSSSSPGGSGSAAIVINVSQYGAKCDSSTNDNTAVNNAFDALRTLTQGVSNNVNGVLVFDIGSRCLVSSINATGFTKGNVIIQQNGKTLYGRQAGVPVVDALGSIAMKWVDLAILSSSDQVPTYGIQIGRIDTTANNGGGAGMVFERLNVTGSYSVAACYNFSGEGVTFYDPICKNTDSVSASYGFVQDGYNHFNITSAFVSQNAPIDQGQSFNNNVIINSHFLSSSATGAAVWLGGIRGHRYISSYAIASASSPACTVIYNENQVNNSGLNQDNLLEIHCEGSAANNYAISGNIAAPVMYGMVFSEEVFTAANAMIQIGSGIVTSASCYGCSVNIHGVASTVTNTARAFANPHLWNAWTGSSVIYTPAVWNEPNGWSGSITLAGNTWNYPDRPGPLDFLSGASGAWSSARRLGRGYVGPVLNVRNTTSSATADIYADSTAPVSLSGLGGILASAASGAVVTEYDQSASSTGNLTQATTASQPGDTLISTPLGGRNVPVFVDAGALALPSSSTLSGLFTTGGFVSAVVSQTASPSVTARMWFKTNAELRYPAGGSACLAFIQSASGSSGQWVAPALTNGGHVIDLQYNAGSISNAPVLAYDGVTQTFGTNCAQSTSQPTGSISADAGAVIKGNSAATGGSRAFPGPFPELIMWKATPAANVLAAIRRNQAGFYGLTGVQ